VLPFPENQAFPDGKTRWENSRAAVTDVGKKNFSSGYARTLHVETVGFF